MTDTTNFCRDAIHHATSAPAWRHALHSCSDDDIRPDLDVAHMLGNLYAYADTFFREDRLDEAEAFFRYLCMYDFGNPEYVLGLAATYQLKRQYAQAVDVYRMVRKLDPKVTQTLFYEGQCLLMLGDVTAASACFEKLLSEGDALEFLDRARRYLSIIADGRSPICTGPACYATASTELNG